MNTNLKIIITAVLLVLTASSLSAQSTLFSKEVYTNELGESLNYRLMISDYDANSRYPLVIFLHGSGERGDDNEAQLKWGIKNFASADVMKNYRPIVIAPQCPSEETWADYSKENTALQDAPTQPMKLLLELVDEMMKNYSIDPDRIYITGLSMGGYGTYDALMRRPELFAAAVPVCGAGDVSKTELIAHIPIWIFHGAKDDVVSPQHAIQMHAELVKEGAAPGFTLYPEAGHFSWIAAYSDPMIMQWLFLQKRQSPGTKN